MSSHSNRSILSVDSFKQVLTNPDSTSDAKVEALSNLWQSFYDRNSAFFTAPQAQQAAYFQALSDIALNEYVDGETRTNSLGALRAASKKFGHAEPILRATFEQLPKVKLKGDASLLVEAAVRGFDQISWESYGRPETTLGSKKAAQVAKLDAA